MDKSLLGRSEVVTQEVILQKDGMWKSTIIVVHKQTKDGENWETRTAQMSSYSNTPESAQAAAVQSMSTYLLTVQFDLFKDINDKNNSTKN